MKSHQLEALLRAPVEWLSCVWCMFVITDLWYLQTQEPNLKAWFTSLSIAIAVVAVLRFYQGYQVFRYQRYLKHLPDYAISSKALPIRLEHLFLGKGFCWQTKHTQRLYDMMRHSKITTQLQQQSKQDERGGNAALHGVEPNEQTIWLKQSERVGHCLILGTTRVGKTRLLELMIASDIQRQDSAVIVFDPKGDMGLLQRICYEAKQVDRSDDVIVFHLGYPKNSARYNPIGQFARITEVANRVANQLPSQGESAAFKEFAWRFVNIIARALVALGKTPTYRDLDKFLLNIDPLLAQYGAQLLQGQDWRDEVEAKAQRIDEKKLPLHLRTRNKQLIALIQHIEAQDLSDEVFRGLKAMFNYDQTYFQKITASLSPLFAKLTTGQIADLISPDYQDLADTRPLFDWLQVIRGKKIVYIGLDALSDATVASAVGNSMFSDICSTIGQIYKFGVQEDISDENADKTFYPVNLYSDEFNELAGDEFIPLANKGGGAGLQLTVATQTASDVIARLGSPAKANQVFGNFNSLICLRVLEESTAKLLISKLPAKVPVQRIVPASSVSDVVNDDKRAFTTQQSDQLLQDSVPLIDSDTLMQLPKGQAFALLEGGKLYKLRFPLPEAHEVDIPDALPELLSWLHA